MKRAEDIQGKIDLLARAARTLDPEHGIVGRRNARARVLAALRVVRAELDAHYPAIRKKASPRKPAKSPQAIRERMHERGYFQTVAARLMSNPLLAKVSVGRTAIDRGEQVQMVFLPFWVRACLALHDSTREQDKAIRRCIRSTTERRAVMVLHAAARAAEESST